MPKPLFLNREQQEQDNVLSLCSEIRSNKQTIFTSQNDRERFLRRRRSAEYIETLTKLDTGNADISSEIDRILDGIRKEFPLIEIPGDLLGYCSKCYLGREYEVHMVDFTGRIIQHFKKNEPMPNGMEKARTLAMDEHYAIIEVYTHCIRAIDEDGNVAVIGE